MSDRSQLTARVTAIIAELYGTDPDVCAHAVEETLHQIRLLTRQIAPLDLDIYGDIRHLPSGDLLWAAPKRPAELELVEAA